MPRDRALTHYLLLAILSSGCSEGHGDRPGSPEDPPDGDPPSLDGDRSPDVPFDPPSLTTEQPFTIGLIPDPQYMTEETDRAPFWRSEMEWFPANASGSANVRFVAALGDLTNHGGEPHQWANVKDMLDALQTGAKLQFAPLGGNHDTDNLTGGIGDYQCADPFPTTHCGKIDHDYTNLNETFPRSTLAGYTSWDASYPYFYASYPFGSIANSAYSFHAGGTNWLVITLSFFSTGQWDPAEWDEGALEWARKIIADAPEKQVILATHSCLNLSGTFWNEHAFLWERVTRLFPNVAMVACGHVYNEALEGARASVTGLNGNPVMHLLSDYQTRHPYSDSAYIRLMKFDAARRRVSVVTYNPNGSKYLKDATNQFVLDGVPMRPQDDDYARGGVVTGSSSFESPDWGSARLVDGHRSFSKAHHSRGFSSDGFAEESPSTPPWVAVDLGEVRKIGKVYLFPRTDSEACQNGGFPIDYRIEASVDGEAFVPVVVVTDAPAPPFNAPVPHAFDLVRARHVRLVATRLRRACLDADDKFRLQLAELEVYTGVRPTTMDSDGDGAAELAVYRPSEKTLYLRNLPARTLLAPEPTDVLLAGVRLDKRAWPTLFRPSTGEWLDAVTGRVLAAQRDTEGGVPLVGQFTADHTSDTTPAVWIGEQGIWRVLGEDDLVLGSAARGDVPVPEDYTGDGVTDYAIWDGATFTWMAMDGVSREALDERQWGQAGDLPVPGDYDGDGQADRAVYRPGTGTWWVLPSRTGEVSKGACAEWGADDVPTPGDFDGDATIDRVVWRPSDQTFYRCDLPAAAGGAPTWRSLGRWGEAGDLPQHLPFALRSAWCGRSTVSTSCGVAGPATVLCAWDSSRERCAAR